MGGVCPTVTDGAIFIRALFEDLPHPVTHDRPGQRRIGRCQTLCDGDEIRLDPVVIRPEHAAQSAKTCDHLIGDQQNVVLA